MNIGEILIWESSNLLLLIPAVIGLLVLTRWLKGRIVHGAGLALSDRPSTGESFFASLWNSSRRSGSL